MGNSFDRDPHPGNPRILFIGLSESTHTHAWIDLLRGSQFNVRLFGLPTGSPPDDWTVRTYLTAKPLSKTNPKYRVQLYPFGQAGWLLSQGLTRFLLKDRFLREERWLAHIIRRWKPHIIHTLGLTPAAEFYYKVRLRFGLVGQGFWVLQLRGGSDLTLSRLDPAAVERIGPILQECDQLLSDNQENYKYARQMNVDEARFSSIGTVPGTGGVNIEDLSKSWKGPPSSRRIILWPKAYESPWSKALPVFEALRLCWDQIQPCEIHMFAMTPEVEMWYRTLPGQIRDCSHTYCRLPRSTVLDLVTQARVMLIPSLVDGTPNSLFEAMAAGAFPIVSPLETITSLVKTEKNVLFARNLYAEEIASALVRAMTDDRLVDQAANRNLDLVRQVANRATIRPKVIGYYQSLLGVNHSI